MFVCQIEVFVFINPALHRWSQTVSALLLKSLLEAVTSIGHAAVDQLVHQVVVALGGGSLMVVEV